MAKAWVENFFAFLNQDVKTPTEIKKNALMTRNVAIVLIPYACLETAAFFLMDRSWTFALPLGLLLLSVCIFRMTYAGKTGAAQTMLAFTLLVWCLLCVLFYGWHIGTQYFFTPLLVYTYGCSFRSIRVKAIEVVGLLVFAVSLFLYTTCFDPFFPLSKASMMAEELLNIVGTFGTLGAALLAFSKDTMKVERKLIDYARELTHLADTDTLTGLMNRRAAYAYFEKLTEDAKSGGFFVNVAIGDIDFFKKVNDTYGHDAGDAVLVYLSHLFTEFVKGKGVVARWGGEEFLFVLSGMNGDEAFVMLDELRHQVKYSDIPFGEKTLHVCMTFGLEEHDLDDSLDVSFERADKKLYMGKQNGRNRVVM